jgi:hypothetical protein
MNMRDRGRLSARPRLLVLEDRTAPTAAMDVVYSGPMKITAGGTYTGNWQSLDPTVPAVQIATAAPVVLQDCHIRSRSTLIFSGLPNANVTIRDCSGYALNPNVAGQAAGRFADIENFSNVDIENNYLEGTSGIWLLNYRGDLTPADTVKVLRNQAHDIDGRKSDGQGGYLAYNERTVNGVTQDGYETVQFFQMDKVLDVPAMEVAWNEVVNDPGQSRVEDNINIYESRGTPTSHLLIHDNYIKGAYTVQPGQASYSDATGSYDWSFSGGGILLGDGDTTDPALVPGYTDAYDNQVVDTTNYGVAITGGHDQQIYDNRVVSSGYLPDGTWVNDQNVGAYIWDSQGLGAAVFYNNVGLNNQSGWVNKPTGARNDWWVPGASSWAGNVHWSGAVTTATEDAEYAYWLNKLSTNGVTVGPPLTVTDIQVNDGSLQRSEVRSFAVTFSGPMNFAGGNVNAAAAFQLNHVQTGRNVALAAAVSTDAQNRTVVTLTFSGSETDPVSGLNGGISSLADGRYQLTVFGSAVTGPGGMALDGDGDGTPGGNYVSPVDTYLGNGLRLYRLFGDANGDGVVDATDVGQFKTNFNRNYTDPLYLWYLDADNSGAIDASDIGQFKSRLNVNVF